LSPYMHLSTGGELKEIVTAFWQALEACEAAIKAAKKKGKLAPKAYEKALKVNIKELEVKASKDKDPKKAGKDLKGKQVKS
jgi:hypothetical protein